MKLNNFNAIYSLANTLYGTVVNPESFEDIALNGWQLIGNRHTNLYKYTTDTCDKKIILPCNIEIIESVTIPKADYQKTSNTSTYPLINNQYVEQYIEAWKSDNSPYYEYGKLLKYHEEDNILSFDKDYVNVTIVYKGNIVDEDGLPLISDKEVTALACYIAYVEKYRKSLIANDTNSFQIAQAIKAEWLRARNDAKVSEKVTQNEIDQILNVKHRWDRKSYNKSYKPIL